MTWIDTVVLTIVTIGGLSIFYKALKEPIDFVFGLLRKVFESIIEKARGSGEEAVETISYG